MPPKEYEENYQAQKKARKYFDKSGKLPEAKASCIGMGCQGCPMWKKETNDCLWTIKTAKEAKTLFKAHTVEQFKILQFIKENFYKDEIELIVAKNCVRVKDKNGDTLYFEWDAENKKVTWK